MDIFAAIADERRAAAGFISGLTPQQLSRPSLCDAWTIHDVAAHLLMPLVTSTPSFVLAFALNRFDFDRANIALTAKAAKRTDAEIVAGLRANALNRFRPPGLGPEAPLTDLLVHGQDMRRPLGISRDFDPDRLMLVLEFLTGPGASRGFIPRSRLADLRFVASDLDFAFGSGAEVSGPAEALMMGIAGRGAALADLGGPGAATLAARL